MAQRRGATLQRELVAPVAPLAGVVGPSEAPPAPSPTGWRATFLYRLARQMIGYLGVAVVAALTEWTTFYVCDGVLGLNIYLATLAGFLLGTLTNFLLGRRSVFRRQAARGLGAVRNGIGVYITSAVGLGLNLLIMYILADRLGLVHLLAKVLATGLVFFWNFFSQKLLVYKT